MNTSEWAFLLPHLRCLPTISTDDMEESSPSLYTHCTHLTVFTAAPPPDATDDTRLETWRRQRDALELLALVHCVDPLGWMHLLTEVACVYFRRPYRPSELPAYAFYFERNDTPASKELFVEQLFEDERDAAFLEARDRILAMASSDDVRAACYGLSIPFQLNLTHANEVAPAMLAQWRRRSCDGSKTRFTFTGVHFVKYHSRVTAAEIDEFQALVANDVPIVDVVFGAFVCSERICRDAIAGFMQQLLGKGGARRLTCPQAIQQRTNEAVFSMLLRPGVASRVRSLDLSDFPVDDTRAERVSGLLWMFYALFGQDSRHGITNVTLMVTPSDLRATDLDWIAERLRAHQAPRMELLIPDVFEEYATSEAPTHDALVQIPRGYPIRTELTDNWRDQVLSFEDRDMSFRVLRDDPTWSFVDILIPGYGRCWVERSDIVKIVHRPLTPWRLDQHSVRSMQFGVMGVNAQEQQSIASLLALVGTPVTLLCFQRWFTRDRVDPEGLQLEILASVVRSCPNLASVSLQSVPFVDVHTVLDLYAMHSCRIRSLNLGVHPFVDALSLLLFLEALADNTLAMTKTLEELAISLPVETIDPNPTGENVRDSDALVLALLRMLETNHNLSVVHVVLSSADQYERFERQFTNHRERLIARQKAPLVLRAKCAFLSVLAHVTSVDKAIFARVFAFAAECETRVVTVAYHPKCRR